MLLGTAAALLALPGIADAAVTSTVAGTELTVASDAGDAIAIASDGTNVTVNGAAVVPATPAATLTKITVDGGPDANAITLVGVTKAAFPAITAVTLDGGGGADTITGSEDPDVMNGGDGNDRLIGDNNDAGTDDVANGEAGDDTMVWNPGDGDDINEGGAGTDTVEVNGGGKSSSPSSRPRSRAACASTASPPAPFNVDIGTSEKLDLNAGGGIDSLVADAGLDALGFKLDISGGEGDDTLDGGDGADLIPGDAGNDTITLDDNPLNTRDIAHGGDSDDTMIWNGGDDDDLNDGGAGNDVSLVNGAPADERFTIKPSATAGRVLFDRLATPGPGAFSVDIGTTEQLRLEANAGNDRIKGAAGVAGRIRTILNAGDGNDRVRGTDAVDAISGGKGNDILNSIDKAEDTVSCDEGFDLALVDRRDFLRQCELAIGGLPKVAVKGKPQLDGNHVALRLKCVATAKCKSVVKLKRKGKTLGSDKVTLKRGKTTSIDIALNARGRRVLSDGDRVKVQILSKDKQGNGWRSTASAKLR